VGGVIVLYCIALGIMFVAIIVIPLFKVSLGTGGFEHQAEENLKQR
jgi:hypothetical protein